MKSWNNKKSKAILLSKKPTVITVFMIMKKLLIWSKIVQMKDALNSRLKFYFDEKNGLKLMKSIRKDFHVSLNSFAYGDLFTIFAVSIPPMGNSGRMSIGKTYSTLLSPYLSLKGFTPKLYRFIWTRTCYQFDCMCCHDNSGEFYIAIDTSIEPGHQRLW